MARPREGRAARLIEKLASPPHDEARGAGRVLLRRLSLSRANKPRKRYEGYDADAKKDNGGLDHWSVGIVGSGPRAGRTVHLL